MGRPSLNFVIKKLQEAGFRTGRAFPGTRMPTIHVPAVTVAIQRDEAASLCLAVTVFCPERMGGIQCEDTAAQVTALLRSLGFDSVQERCQYDGKGDRFFIRILATWLDGPPQCPFTVFLGNLTLKYLKQVTVVQKTELEPLPQCGQEGILSLRPSTGPWIITIEEAFPPEAEETANPTGPFSILLRRGALGEQYINCCWTEIRREDTAAGLHQRRTALCQQRKEILYE